MNITVSSFQTLQSAKALTTLIQQKKLLGMSIGFVPTMGALHQGHLSLVEEATKANDFVVVSIFVNPTQFNNKEDLALYPRTPEQDISLLASTKANVVFLPSVEEIYPEEGQNPTIDLGHLDKVMEGAFRPGHFDGVVNVVNRLFNIVQPHTSYFGRKDFQQVAVIRHFAKILHPSISIAAVPTLRNEHGLALSSRNMLLTEEQKAEALIIYRIFLEAKDLAKHNTPIEVITQVSRRFEGSSLRLEYIEIVDPETLHPLRAEWISGATCCIAAFCGNVRLIDNFEVIPC